MPLHCSLRETFLPHPLAIFSPCPHSLFYKALMRPYLQQHTDPLNTVCSGWLELWWFYNRRECSLQLTPVQYEVGQRFVVGGRGGEKSKQWREKMCVLACLETGSFPALLYSDFRFDWIMPKQKIRTYYCNIMIFHSVSKPNISLDSVWIKSLHWRSSAPILCYYIL
jgi:hypothetical protein